MRARRVASGRLRVLRDRRRLGGAGLERPAAQQDPAPYAALGTAREALDLKDDIRIWTDKGEEARLRSAAVTFKTGAISSQEPVTVSSPRATVNADTLDVVESGKRISFVGNVHVVIVNEDQAEKPPARILTSDAEAGGVGR